MAGRIQNEDIKSSAELIAAGGAASQLPNDNKVWVAAKGLNETLFDAITNGDLGGTGFLNAKFELNDAVVPYVNIGSAHRQVNAFTLTNVYISMLNSGSSGSTVIQLNQFRAGALFNSATASISASSGNPSSANAALSGSIVLAAGDVITVDIVSIASGAPEGLTVEY